MKEIWSIIPSALAQCDMEDDTLLTYVAPSRCREDKRSSSNIRESVAIAESGRIVDAAVMTAPILKLWPAKFLAGR